jgi:hypothetical protein
VERGSAPRCESALARRASRREAAVAPPVIGILHRPLPPSQCGQLRGRGVGARQASDEVAAVVGGFAVLFEGGGVAGVEDLVGGRKGQCIRIDGRHAHGAGFNAAAVGFGLDKRGVALANLRWMFFRTVG